jgi:hypothetical protein
MFENFGHDETRAVENISAFLQFCGTLGQGSELVH